MKYTLYHIKGLKWGMTKTTLKKRFYGHDYIKKGLTINDVCETEVYYDKSIAADREKELNLRDGYPWNDSQDYRVISNAYKVSASKRKGKPLSEETKFKISEVIKGTKRSEETKLKISGSNNVWAKLTEADVLSIRNKYIPHVYSSRTLANEYGVNKSLILDIVKRRAWKHI